MHLALFLLTLSDEEKQLANSLEEEEARTWDSSIEKFMKKFFPTIENARRRQNLVSFKT